MARSDTREDDIQKRVELVRLKAKQVGNMEPERPGLVNAAAQAQLAKLIPAREEQALGAIEVDRLPAPVDPNAYFESLTGMLSTLEAEVAKEQDFTLPDTSALEGEIDQRIANEEASGFVQVANRERLSLVDRMIQQESGGDPNAVSRVGASGLTQVMEATAADPGFGVTPLDWDDRFDPQLNRAFGTEYLNAMLKRYNGDEEAALIAYNAGFGRADKWLAAGRDYEQFWWSKDADGNPKLDDNGNPIPGWAQESKSYTEAIMGNNSLAPERAATYGDVVYSAEDVAANVSQIAEVEAGIASSELAMVGAQIPGLTQSESVHRFTYPRAGQGMLDGIDTSYMVGHSGEEPVRDTLYADIMAHHAAAQGLKDMAFIKPVQIALERMPADSFLAWSDATRGRDPLHREQAELALLLAGYEPRDWLNEEKPSDRFFNAHAYARLDGGYLSDLARSDAGEGPLRHVLAAARRMVFNR
jgi:hypothetical protein